MKRLSHISWPNTNDNVIKGSVIIINLAIEVSSYRIVLCHITREYITNFNFVFIGFIG